jgi:GNAT superfamily N-acetyltransferase
MAAAFSTIFDDFAMQPPAAFNGLAFERRFVFEHLDRTASTLVTFGERPAATILIARRGRTSHISGLGVAKAYRRAGIAKRLLMDACAAAKIRGDTRMLVEVPVDATAALTLYDACGFQKRRRLLGFTKTLQPTEGSDIISEIEPTSVATVIGSAGVTDLPWFFDPASLVGCALPTRAFHIDKHAYAIATSRGDELNLRALFVRHEVRRRGLATRLIAAMARHTSATRCSVLPLVPEGLCDEFFAATMFARLPQVHYGMERLF